jgi:hypothetical protein
MKGILILFLTLIICSCTKSNVSLKGKVVKLDDEFRYEYVNVRLLQNGKQISKTKTDKGGNYRFDSISDGVYDLVFWESSCYNDKIIKGIVVNSDQIQNDVVFPDRCIPSKKICPKNKTDLVIPIVYGLPSEDTAKNFDEGKVSLGGCSEEYCPPRWYCKAHNLRF